MHKFMFRPLALLVKQNQPCRERAICSRTRSITDLQTISGTMGKGKEPSGSPGGCEAHTLGVCSLLSLASSQQSLLPPQAKGRGCTTSLVHPWRRGQGSQGGKLSVFRGRQVTEGDTSRLMEPVPSWRVCAHPEAWVPSLHKTHLLGKSLLEPPV